MKKIFLFALLFYPLFLNAQTPLTKSYDNQFKLKDCPNSAKPTPDGGIIIAGYISDSLLNNRQGSLVKLDALHNVEWAKYYDAGTTVFFTSVELTNDSAYLLIGDIYQTASMPIYPSGIYVVKTDLSGNVIWSRCIGGFEAIASATTSDHGFLITGQSGISTPTGGASAINISRLDSEGNLLWSKVYGASTTTLGELGLSIKESPEHDIYVTGLTNAINTIDGAIILLKTDSIGTLQWGKTYDGAYNPNGMTPEAARDIHIDPNGDLLITGVGVPNSTSFSLTAILMKLRPDGTLKWGRSISMMNYSVEGKKVIPFDGGYAVEYTNGLTRSTGIAVTDIDGRTIWAKEYPGIPNGYAYGYGFSLWQSGQSEITSISATQSNYDDILLIQTNSNVDSCSNFVPAGTGIDTTYSPTITSVSYNSASYFQSDSIPVNAISLNYTDSVLCPTIFNSTGSLIELSNSILRIYPSPASEKISIKGNGTLPYTITNILGEIFDFKILSVDINESMTLDISGLHSGLYIISNGLQKGMFVKQ